MPLNTVHFGAYELDRDAMELRKHGHRIRLQDQPLLVLVALLERPGEIVTREQLQQRIWAKDTFVDFDQSLNKAVNRLRETLNDDAGQPRYIETVPRRGYRFVAPVTVVNPPVAAPEPQTQGSRNSRIKTARRLAAVTIIVGLAVGASLWMRGTRPSNGATRKPPIRVTTHGMPFGATVSRDGKLLAYTASTTGDAGHHLWVQQLAGGTPMQVTRGPVYDWAPDFSPDGTRIVFQSERNGGGIYIVPTFGGEPTRLVSGAVGLPAFSPNGKEVLYRSELLSFQDGLWVVSADGGEPRRLCPEYTWDSPGLWSPDGASILSFGWKREDRKNGWKWLLVPAGGGEPTAFPIPGGTDDKARSPTFRAWRKSRDRRQWLIFSYGGKDSGNLFRVATTSAGRPVGNVEQITFDTGTGMNCCVDVSEDGTLIFPSGALAGQVLIIPADTNRGTTQGPPRQITHSEGVLNTSSTVSRDGRWLAYSSIKPTSGETSIRLHDLTTGTEREVLAVSGTTYVDGFSPDGSQIVYNANLNERWSTFLIPTAGGASTKICDDCQGRGFTADGSVVLTQQIEDQHGKALVVAVRVKGGFSENLLVHPTNDLWHAYYAWDDKWVAFKMALHGAFAKVALAPIRNGAAGKEKDWIYVTDGTYVDDKPQFAPDGNTLYFTSTRDGHLCIWARRLDQGTKRPAGEAFAVQHFHEWQPWIAYPPHASYIGLTVASDKIATHFVEFRGGLWMTKLD